MICVALTNSYIFRLQLELLDPLTDVTTPEGTDSEPEDAEVKDLLLLITTTLNKLSKAVRTDSQVKYLKY